ncbi:MAG TPA: RcnB family protein [Sphingomicrobium sp.]|jgi:Ni/Co efflux regulator RcnB|nr:RcnB family protein [Sphingomicrobium sp.]
MKKLTLALAGASIALTGVAASPAAAADFRGHDRGRVEQVQTRQVVTNRFENNRFNGFANNRVQDNRFQARSWQRGDRFDSRYATNYRVIDNPGYYHLRAAPYGYRWVQSGNDAVLIAITSGIIGALIGNAF